MRLAGLMTRPWFSGVRALAAALLGLSGLSCADANRTDAPPSAVPRLSTGKAAGAAEPALPGLGIPLNILDARLEHLVHAAERWKRSQGPDRRVIDQVYLVPDVSTFLEVIAAWDDQTYFPVLLDDPAWSLPFLRAFRPTRIVRIHSGKEVGSRPDRVPPGAQPSDTSTFGLDLWRAARRAVSRAWSALSVGDESLPDPGAFPRQLGPTPAGLVLSNPESPMLPAAVALAAGRFQPLVRLDPLPFARGIGTAGPRFKRFQDVLSLPEARAAARRIEALAAAAVPDYGSLGDDCDFLTLALDWPYRYRNDVEEGVFRGDCAFDDLAGRIIKTDEGSLASSRFRWAFTGRLLGSPAASVYRAMCSLFLQPEASVLWNTYAGDGVWATYGMTSTVGTLGRFWSNGPAPVLQEGSKASLTAWHRQFDPVHRFGWIMVNSSGNPDQFSIAGGTGRPADLPRGFPSAVTMIHSFSAADPRDAATLAGRWLENGAFVYFGSMNEPFLHAFRPPSLVAELAAAAVPLAAAVRAGEHEPFGRPWRLVYLGDPLYSLRPPSGDPRRNRREPTERQTVLRQDLPWITEEITAASVPVEPAGDAAARLEACLGAAFGDLCKVPGGAAPGSKLTGARSRPSHWRDSLSKIDRARLAADLRPSLDELMIDAFSDDEHAADLLAWLLKIPATAASPRVEQAIETVATRQLYHLSGRPSFNGVLDVWEAVMTRPWPVSSRFPDRFSDRVAAMADSRASTGRTEFRDRATRVVRSLESLPELAPQAAVVTEQLKRIAAGEKPR